MRNTGCQRNMAGRDEDPRPPFVIAYRPCNALPVVDVRSRYIEACMCHEHAREAELEGAEVDWP